jgi:CRISPR-associated protein Csb1
MTEATVALVDGWADNSLGPVALHMKQRLLPVEGEGGVVFPPTYADIGYNLDTLSDGTKVVTIDSVGSQANRMEPIFKAEPYAQLVPQIEIDLQAKSKQADKYVETRSLLDLAHRSADAVVYATPGLNQLVASAYKALHEGNAAPLACIAPTSLLFGVWDSRGGSGEKRPRLVRSIIRAWDVDPLFAAAQFNSVWKQLDDDQRLELDKIAKAKKLKLSVKGFADAPATFRKVSNSAARYMTEYREGSPNPERRVLGGVRVNGRIERDVTVNLVALRSIRGSGPEETTQLRRYLLALALLAANHDFDHFLREGCNLRVADLVDSWLEVPRRGEPTPVSVSLAAGAGPLLDYAAAAAKPFKARWPKELAYKFDLKEAAKLLAKKDDTDEPADGE